MCIYMGQNCINRNYNLRQWDDRSDVDCFKIWMCEQYDICHWAVSAYQSLRHRRRTDVLSLTWSWVMSRLDSTELGTYIEHIEEYTFKLDIMISYIVICAWWKKLKKMIQEFDRLETQDCKTTRQTQWWDEKRKNMIELLKLYIFVRMNAKIMTESKRKRKIVSRASST